MIRKLTLAAGFGAGYVLGAKAGTERYDQIMVKVRELMGQPAVQDFTSKASSTASAAADKAKATVNEKVESVSGKASSSDEVVVDLGSHSAATTPASNVGTGSSLGTGSGLGAGLGTGGLGTGPIVGASASGTAPDVV